MIPEPLGRLVISQDYSGIIVVVPHLPQGLSEEGINADLKLLIDGLFAEHHINKYAFPSSVDVAHFAKARNFQEAPADQVNIPYPRLGFFGVIDERIDIIFK